MKYFLILVSTSFLVGATEPEIGSVTKDYSDLLARIAAISASLRDYNYSSVSPAYTCDENWEPEQKYDVHPQVDQLPKSESDKNIEESSEFKSDENPNQASALPRGCVQDKLDILEKCFYAMADKLRRSQIKMHDLPTLPHEGFQIRSHSKDRSQARSWEFHHEGRARQDAGLTVMDGYHYGKGNVYAAEMMFFPRKKVPQYAIKGDLLEVVLANGEVVNFDSSTGAIRSGVLTENKPVKGGKPDIKYDGSGVMIQMIGVDGGAKSYKETANDAVIYKKGFPPCKVRASELWPDQKRDKANSFRFATDEGLNNWLKQSKCGFNL